VKRALLWLVIGIGFIFALARLFGPQIIEMQQNRILQAPPYQASAQAGALQRTLLVVDLHADSLLWGRNLLDRGTRGTVDLPRLLEANSGIQGFTLVSSVPWGLNIERNEESSDMLRWLAVIQGWPSGAMFSAKGRALYQADRMQKFVADSGGKLVLLRTRGELDEFLKKRAAGAHQVAALLGSEGAQPLEGTLANLDALFAAGYRMMSPSHFTDTPVGGSAAGAQKGGLTPLGRDWVRAMEQRGMLIDVAHSSPATLRDVTAMATKPVIVSHTGVKGTCDNNRNLSDDELRGVAATGGVIGIGFWETATCGRDALAIAKAMRYTANLVGAEHVGLGSDFDGAVAEPFDVTGLVVITDALLQAGFSEQEVRLIMGENFARVLAQVLPQ
jgi:microsomal dipeptidase-like Zn-dependent dipeptidase